MQDSRQESNSGHAFRFGLRALLLSVGLLGVMFGGYAWFDRTIAEPMRRVALIERQIESLAARRPSNLTPRQWESAVAWTLNLHGNSLIRFQAETDEIVAFQQRLGKQLAGPVDLTTIHWIWDEYAQVCPGGANYQRFREMMIEEIEAGGGDWSLKVR
jgi:hypothetical protein